MQPEVRYCTTKDGIRIAYTVTGDGPPLVACTEPGLSHAQLEWSHPLISRVLLEFARNTTLIRFDPRGCGMSDRVLPQALDEWVADMEAVVERTGLREFSVAGVQNGVLTAVAFAARHPQQVSSLVLVNGFARNSDLQRTPQMHAMFAAAEADWVMATELSGAAAFGIGREESLPHGTYLRSCIGPEYFEHKAVFATFDVTDLARRVTAPTLVVKHDALAYVTMDMVKELTALIPNAQLVVVPGSWLDDPEGQVRRGLEFINVITGVAVPFEPASPSPSQPPSSALRTVLFTDLAGHTEMMSRLGDERGREVLREHERITREVLKAHGGTEVKTMGDGFMASFGSVTKAVACAVELQRAFAEREGEPLSVRVGLNAGEPIEEEGDLFGATVILASRIASQAGGGEIFVADTVRGLCSGKGFLFSDRGEFVAKGFEEPVRTYEVRWRE